MNQPSILVADDQFLSRKGMLAFLGTIGRYIFDEADTPADLLSKSRTIDLLIINYNSGPFNSTHIRNAILRNPSLKVLAVTQCISNKDFNEAMAAGVHSHLLKDCAPDEIAEAIEKTLSGEKFFCGKILDSITKSEEQIPTSNCSGFNITERELEIITLIAEGHANKQIAEMLCLSTHTVNTHRKNIMNKLGINNSAGLVMFAIKENLITPNKFLFSSPSL